MIGILLIVLVVNGKGGLTNIVYSNESPYLIFQKELYSSDMRNLIKDFQKYIETIEEQQAELIKIKEKFEDLKVEAEIDIKCSQIAESVTKLDDYDIRDIVNSVSIVDANCKIIKENYDSLKKMLEVPENVRSSIKRIFTESLQTNNLERIIQKAVQARHLRLASPKEIVKYFWSLEPTK